MSLPRLRKLPPVPPPPPKTPAPVLTAPTIWENVAQKVDFMVFWSPTARIYRAILPGGEEFTNKNRQPVVDWLRSHEIHWDPYKEARIRPIE